MGSKFFGTRPDPVEVAAQDDSVAMDVATLKADFNALLAKLRAAGVMDATTAPTTTTTTTTSTTSTSTTTTSGG